MNAARTLATHPGLRLRTAEDFDDSKSSDSESNALSPETRLSELFDRYFLPVYLMSTQADAKTVAEYRTALNHWIRFTWDPPLRIINNAACAAFVFEDLNRESGEPISPNTVRKHCTHLQMILNAAGPQTKQCPWAVDPYGLFGLDPFGRPRSIPWFTKPPERDKLPTDGFTLEEIEALIEACRNAVKPVIPECPPSLWWRSLLLFDYNTGIRIGSLIKLRRSWIRRNGDDGSIEIPADAYKKRRPKTIYLSPEAVKAVDAIPTGDLIFPWPQSIVSLQRYRCKLLAMAGISEERWFGFHGLRKAIGTEVWSLSPAAAQLQLGHEDQSTTRKNYVNPNALGAALSAELGPTMRRVRQPRKPSPQKTLF